MHTLFRVYRWIWLLRLGHVDLYFLLFLPWKGKKKLHHLDFGHNYTRQAMTSFKKKKEKKKKLKKGELRLFGMILNFPTTG